ncbi:MAG: hypothetical protein ACREJQ_01070, partial [bacterium]
ILYTDNGGGVQTDTINSGRSTTYNNVAPGNRGSESFTVTDATALPNLMLESFAPKLADIDGDCRISKEYGR